MKIKSEKDFWSGVMFTAVGTAFAIGARTYNVGEAARMGPGYFPLLLGIVLALIGLFVIAESMIVDTTDGEKIGKFAWKPLVCIIGANLLFGVLLAGLPAIKFPAFGLIVAIYGLTFVASLASERFSVKEVLIVATILAVLSYVAFVWLLKLQFPVWPSFIVG